MKRLDRRVAPTGGRRVGRALVVASLLFAAAPASAQEDVREVAARVHREGGYGERLSVDDGRGGPRIVFGGRRGGAAREDAAPRARREQQRPGTLSVPPGSSSVTYVLLAVAIVVVIVLLVGVLARSRGKTGELAPPYVRARPSSSAPPPGRSLAELEGDPDALAGAGRYAEAIAAAMIGGLRAVGWRAEGHGKSRTAREILASVDASDARRAPLAELVRIEERVAFGGDDATKERWDQARAVWIEIGSGGAAP